MGEGRGRKGRRRKGTGREEEGGRERVRGGREVERERRGGREAGRERGGEGGGEGRGGSIICHSNDCASNYHDSQLISLMIQLLYIDPAVEWLV